MNSENIENTAYLSLGSNLGNRKANLFTAIHQLEEKTAVNKLSMMCESESWGYNDKNYLNICLEIKTNLNPFELLIFTQHIETEIGRNEKTKVDEHNNPVYKSRIIDIDILLYNNVILHTKDLVIPHSKLHLRKFVLMPLNNIAPKLIHPVLHKSINTLYNICKDDLLVIPYKK